MRITQSFGSYNPRRYGKPWIGIITSWPTGNRAEISWGGYVGDASGGEVEIEAHSGDVIRWGQKDHRGNGGSANWGIVQPNGSVSECDAVEAKNHWIKQHEGKA